MSSHLKIPRRSPLTNQLIHHANQAKGENTLDHRSRSLGGDAAWFRTDLAVYSKPSQFKLHDWLQLALCCGDYILHDLFPMYPERMGALYSLFAVVREVVNCTSVAGDDDDDDDKLARLRVQLLEAVCLCEVHLPCTELSVLFHVLIHFPDCIHRWNSIRNFWCFWTERYKLPSQR